MDRQEILTNLAMEMAEWPEQMSYINGFCEEEWLAERERLIGKPSWDDAPVWANWLAQDHKGHWWWLDSRPFMMITASEWQIISGTIKCIASYGATPAGHDWRHTLEKRPDQCNEYEDDAFDHVQRDIDRRNAKPASKYHREIAPGVYVDVYDVLNAWQVTNPALQHLIKKSLCPGGRGHKTKAEDLDEIIASAKRAKEIES